MLERERPDMVSICLPPQETFSLTLEVIRAGIPLFVEKPLVFAERESEVLLEEAAKRNLFFAINFNLRYAKPAELARQAIHEGRLGDIVFANWRSGGEGSSSHPYANLIETQCHGFDLLELLCGPIESVMAQMTDKTGQGFRSIVLALRFRSGAVGSTAGQLRCLLELPQRQLLGDQWHQGPRGAREHGPAVLVPGQGFGAC